MTGRKRLGGWAAAAVLLAVFLLSAADSRYHLQVTEHELFFSALPPELDGLRVVHLSDLHGAVFGRENRRLAELVRLLEPDLIALTGDFAGEKSQLPAAEALLAGLDGLAPVYYVSGNHEWAGGVAEDMRRMLERRGGVYLANEARVFEKNGGHILVAGAEDPNGPADMIRPDRLAENIRRERPADFILWLGHRNYWVEQYPLLPVDLILSGHAHGGIIRLPFVGGLLNVKARLGADYETGLYRSGRYRMEVSRGLGNSVPIPRLFNRPEVVVLTLRSGADNG